MESAGQSTTAPRRARLAAPARRESLLAAASEIIIEAGPSAVTMDGVAARTGVNKRLAYRFFANRDEILKALLEQELEESGRRARALLPDVPTLEQRVSVNVRVWLEIMQERGPLFFRLLYDQDVAAPLARDVNRRARLDWTNVYRDALDVPEVTAELLARILLAALRGAVEALHREVAPLDQIADVYTTLVLTGAHEIARKARSGAPTP